MWQVNPVINPTLLVTMFTVYYHEETLILPVQCSFFGRWSLRIVFQFLVVMDLTRLGVMDRQPRNRAIGHGSRWTKSHCSWIELFAGRDHRVGALRWLMGKLAPKSPRITIISFKQYSSILIKHAIKPAIDTVTISGQFVNQAESTLLWMAAESFFNSWCLPMNPKAPKEICDITIDNSVRNSHF